jgi:hypothetical protein
MEDVRLGVEVELLGNFSVIKETLERIGINAREKKKFYPSCYLVEDEGEYRIYHFKELFLKDGNDSSYVEKDRFRRNTICFLLQKWGLIKVKDPAGDDAKEILVEKVDILPHKDKGMYRICHKYLFKRSVL